VVDVAESMEEEEGRDVKQRAATRELEVVDVAEPMGRDVKWKVVTVELNMVDVAQPMEEGGDVK